jgi:hypothetical protein
MVSVVIGPGPAATLAKGSRQSSKPPKTSAAAKAFAFAQFRVTPSPACRVQVMSSTVSYTMSGPRSSRMAEAFPPKPMKTNKKNRICRSD